MRSRSACTLSLRISHFRCLNASLSTSRVWRKENLNNHKIKKLEKPAVDKQQTYVGIASSMMFRLHLRSNYPPEEWDGILNMFINSHFSLVRDQNPNKKYWKRFGRDSHRGINHILFPRDKKFKSWILNESLIGKIKFYNFFVSDHALISCTFLCIGKNNDSNLNIKKRMIYNKISHIPIVQNIYTFWWQWIHLQNISRKRKNISRSSGKNGPKCICYN